MKKHLFLLISLAFFGLSGWAQELKVIEFRADMSMTDAVQFPKEDLNGDRCGLIRMGLVIPDATFEGDIISSEYKDGEWWIYMIKDANWITIKSSKYLPLRYEFEEIQSNVTYVMNVEVPKSVDQKAVVAIGEFTGKNAQEMRDACIASMPTCRVNIVDWNTVKDNDEAANVQYIVTGSIGNVACERKEGTNILTNNKYIYYSSKVTFTLVMKDAKSGKVMATRNSYSTGSNESREIAITNCLKISEEECRRLVDNGAVITVPIQAIKDGKKNSVKTVIVAGGSEIGICEGLYFDVKKESKVANKVIYETIGTAKVKEVLSEDLTVVEITEGNKELKALMDINSPVVVVSKEEPKGVLQNLFGY